MTSQKPASNAKPGLRARFLDVAMRLSCRARNRQKSSNARRNVGGSWFVDTPVPRVATSAGSKAQASDNIKHVLGHVEGPTNRVRIDVVFPVIQTNPALRVTKIANSDANMHGVEESVANSASLAPKNVLGPVGTAHNAACPAAHPAIDYHAMHDVISFSNVDTNVPPFAERFVRAVGIVKSVETQRSYLKSSITLNSNPTAV